MKASKRIQNRIEELAKKHGIDLYKSGAHLRLEQSSYMPLVIENIGQNCISVAHYYEQNGDLIADPDVVFFVGYRESGFGWVPIEITQPPLFIVGMGSTSGYNRLALIDDKGEKITHIKTKAQADVNKFVNQWATNIRRQGWLEYSVTA